MYISRIALDTRIRDTIRFIASPHFVHGAVENSFVSKDERKLWRIDKLNETLYLLVLSSEKPNFEHIYEKYGFSDAEIKWETLDYDKLLSRVEEGQKWNFRLCANPVNSSKKNGDIVKNRGKIFAHVTREQQKKWLIEKSKQAGFSLNIDEFEVMHTSWKRFSKSPMTKNAVSIKVVCFEGLLTVTDLQEFKNTLQNGIGRAKAYGCGFLTIAKQIKEM